eukprot:scaffold173691_cov26-Tisochrysis_lutea.AAC.1
METGLGIRSPPPRSVRIKRQRDEPSLPGLVLSDRPSKRPSLAALSLGEASSEPAATPSADPSRRRYRLVATVSADGCTVVRASRASASGPLSAAHQRHVRQASQARKQAAARFERVRSSRFGRMQEGDDGVLELQRVHEKPRPSPAVPPKLKLRPFGPPLPSSAQRANHAAEAQARAEAEAQADVLRGAKRWGSGRAGQSGSAEEVAMWEDAAAAAADESSDAMACNAEAASTTVYDIYELVEAAEGDEGESEDGGPSEFEPIWWAEAEDDLVDDPDIISEDSDSEGAEVDYPEDEESEVSSAPSASDADESEDEGGGMTSIRARYHSAFYF